MKTKHLKAAVAGGLTVAVGWMLVGSLTGVHVAPASEAQVREIVGDDLAWQARPSGRPTIALQEFEDRAGIASLQRLKVRQTASPKEILSKASEIDRTEKVTHAAAELLRTYDLEPLKPKIIDWNHDEPLEALRLALFAQILLSIVREDSAHLVKRIQDAAIFDRLQGPSDGVYSSLQVTDPLIVTAIRRKNLSAKELRGLYELVAPPQTPDAAIQDAIKYKLAGCVLLIQAVSRMSPDPMRAAIFGDLPGVRKAPINSLAGEFDVPATIRTLAALAREALKNETEHTWNWKAVDELRLRTGKLPRLWGKRADDPMWKTWLSQVRFNQRLKGIPNGLGLLLIASAALDDAFSSQLDGCRMQETWREDLRLRIALMIYQKTFGRLPLSLAELSSLRLPNSLPIDPSSNLPFHYDFRKKAFWGVGRNRVDDGGRGDDGIVRLQ